MNMNDTQESSSEYILELKDVTKIYSSGIIKVKKTTGAKNITFNLKRGEILSIVGESGSGKSTIANMILRLIEKTEGEILLNGQLIDSYSKRNYYQRIQAIFQDPYGSYNQFYRIDRTLMTVFSLRPEKLTLQEKKKVINDVLKKIGLVPTEVLGRYPHQLSGGQLQRFLIARILIIKPDLLVADEMTSMIDASSRAGILNLLEKLCKDEGLSVLFITHDIGQAQYISDKVIVMEKGEIVEMGSVENVLANPQHRYTKELLGAVPTMYERWHFLQSLTTKK